jgi:hypothetical protein
MTDEALSGVLLAFGMQAAKTMAQANAIRTFDLADRSLSEGIALSTVCSIDRRVRQFIAEDS